MAQNLNLNYHSIPKQSTQINIDTFIEVKDFKGKLNQLFRMLTIVAPYDGKSQEQILEKARTSKVIRPAYSTLESIFKLKKRELRLLNLMIYSQSIFDINFMAQKTLGKYIGSDRTRVCRMANKLANFSLIEKEDRKYDTCLYFANTIFLVPEVRDLFKSILPALRSLPIGLLKNSTLKYKEVYISKLNMVKDIVKNGLNPGSLSLSQFCFLQKLGTATVGRPRFFSKEAADRWTESQTFSLNGAMDGQGLKRSDSFKAEAERNSMEVQISPVIDGISQEVVPLTLAGRIFLSQYPDSALEHGLSLLTGKESDPFKTLKNGAWQYVLDNGLARLKDRPERLRKEHNIAEFAPLVEVKSKPKTSGRLTGNLQGERYKTANYKDLYEEFALRQLEGREPITFNPFEGRMKGQGDMTRAEYDAQQEEERARILEDRNEKGRIAREEKITALRETFAFTKPTPMAINPDDQLEKLGLAAQTLGEHKSMSDNANKAYFKALSMTSGPVREAEPVPYDGDDEWEEVFDV